MSISIDIDFFPLRDPTHVHDIVAELGEDSAFHEQHGYYLDPISSSILVLPPGWRERLVMLEFGGIHAYFLDVNDTAISKYVRSAENDFRWIDAGLETGLLDLDIIEGRAQFEVDYPGEHDQRRVHNGIRSHRAARNEDGTLRHEMLAACGHILKCVLLICRTTITTTLATFFTRLQTELCRKLNPMCSLSTIHPAGKTPHWSGNKSA
jgi:hypothetical protein